MAGRFEGVSDVEWRLFEDIFPPAPQKRGRGMPHAPFRKVLNTLLYVLITDCRWCDVPHGPQWASKSATYRWLKRWHGDGTLATRQVRILILAEELGMIQISEAVDEWDDFRDEGGGPISVEELKQLNLQAMPEDIHIWIIDSYFPETILSCEGEFLICEIQEHLYTKFWEHKFSAYAFAEAMERAVRRLIHEGHPFANPTRDDEDVHIFVQWQLRLPRSTQPTLGRPNRPPDIAHFLGLHIGVRNLVILSI
jgi:transposase